MRPSDQPQTETVDEFVSPLRGKPPLPKAPKADDAPIEGKEVRSWDMGRHSDMFVIALAFSPDNKQLVSANANTTVYVLDLP